MQIISKFKEKPKTRIAWRAMWLGLGTLLVPPFLGIFAAVIRPMIDAASLKSGSGADTIGMVFGFAAALFALALSVSALVAGISAFKKGERSWVLWVGLVPAILIGCFWIFMFIGEFLFPH